MTVADDTAAGEAALPPPTSAEHAVVGDLVREVFARANDPGCADELCQLYIGAVEAQLGPYLRRPDAVAKWRAARRRREVTDEEILTNRATVRWIKELFNHYFRDDLYGILRQDRTVILSSGSPDETIYGLPPPLKGSIATALDRDWYGYSDSRGRRPSRRAVADLENRRITGGPYDDEWIALTMGGTFAIACLSDFLLSGARPTSPALCAIPNYPPLVEAIARRGPVKLVPVATEDARTDITNLISALQPHTPLVFLQTVTNPTGTRVPEEQIAQLVRTASPTTVIVLDEAHECLSSNPGSVGCSERARRNVVRVISLSKSFSAPGVKAGWLVAHPDLMRDYYEYASTTYGGPPSLFYLFVEMAARFEAWVMAEREAVSERHVDLFEPTYGFTRGRLTADYQHYRRHRRDREARIIAGRDRAYARLATSGCRPTVPTHSINISFRPPSCTSSSYAWFRRCLAETDTSCFPGLLTFGLLDDTLRITTARRDEDLSVGLGRIVAFTTGRP